MWKLYLLLKPLIEKEKLEGKVIDEVQRMVDLATPQTLLRCMDLLYDNVEFESMEEFNLLFINALLKSSFFEFVGFVRGINASN